MSYGIILKDMVLLYVVENDKAKFAEILSKRYQIVALCKDCIKEVLGDTIGFSNRMENKKLFVATVELMVFIFSEFSKLGKDLILAANFHEEELEKFHQIVLERNIRWKIPKGYYFLI